MSRRLLPVAIVYDFDGTLAKGNMQEHSFIPNIGMQPRIFWRMVNQSAKENEADTILTYMNLMLKKANEAEIPIRKEDFIEHGRSVKLFKGVSTWFDRINNYGQSKKLKIEHYIISSGIREMIAGTPIAAKFKKIYASSFKYNASGAAEWPALAINYTTKTQYLFRINKGALEVYDDKKINKFVKMEDRPIPFENMIFIGDGETDIPCFSLVKKFRGHSIAVYKPHTQGFRARANQLTKDGRINFMAPADYSAGKRIELIVKAVLDKISEDSRLFQLGKH